MKKRMNPARVQDNFLAAGVAITILVFAAHFKWYDFYAQRWLCVGVPAALVWRLPYYLGEALLHKKERDFWVNYIIRYLCLDIFFEE